MEKSADAHGSAGIVGSTEEPLYSGLLKDVTKLAAVEPLLHKPVSILPDDLWPSPEELESVETTGFRLPTRLFGGL
jgi:hypothetical protein